MKNNCTVPATGETYPFHNAEELAALNSTINFGWLRGGSTNEFFAKSNNPTYKRLYERAVSAEPSTLTYSLKEGNMVHKLKKNSFLRIRFTGIERAKKGDYAFFMESTTIHYVVERDCDLVQVGPVLNSKGSLFTK